MSSVNYTAQWVSAVRMTLHLELLPPDFARFDRSLESVTVPRHGSKRSDHQPPQENRFMLNLTVQAQFSIHTYLRASFEYRYELEADRSMIPRVNVDSLRMGFTQLTPECDTYWPYTYGRAWFMAHIAGSPASKSDNNVLKQSPHFAKIVSASGGRATLPLPSTAGRSGRGTTSSTAFTDSKFCLSAPIPAQTSWKVRVLRRPSQEGARKEVKRLYGNLLQQFRVAQYLVRHHSVAHLI